MWKSREAFEKSTFFQRLRLQGLESLDGLWEIYASGELRQKRSFRLNSLRLCRFEDFRKEDFQFGKNLNKFPEVFEFDLSQNARHARHPLWGAGLAYVQDPVALEIVADLALEKNLQVLDLCAAPGGKSIRIAELLQHSGWIVSNDADHKRARILSNNLLRHGVFNSSVFCEDGAKLAQSFARDFDRILIDAPCSGESLFFKREDKRRDVYESEVQECVQLQLKLLQAAAPALREGGRLVYSTCTYNLSENEENVRRFLKSVADFQLLKEERRWPQHDGTAGGYWAVLQKGGAPAPAQAMGFRQDCLRHGLSDSKGSPDIYAHAMNAELSTPDKSYFSSSENLFSESVEAFQDWILMTTAEGDAYLSGEALPNPERKRGLMRMLWRGRWPLGPAKGVESRFNNLLPLEGRRRG